LCVFSSYFVCILSWQKNQEKIVFGLWNNRGCFHQKNGKMKQLKYKQVYVIYTIKRNNVGEWKDFDLRELVLWRKEKNKSYEDILFGKSRWRECAYDHLGCQKHHLKKICDMLVCHLKSWRDVAMVRKDRNTRQIRQVIRCRYFEGGSSATIWLKEWMASFLRAPVTVQGRM